MRLLSSATCLLMLALPAALEAQATVDRTTPEPMVVVTATRTARLAAERATIMLLVEATSETADEAVQRARAKASTVQAAVRNGQAGIANVVMLPISVVPSENRNGYPVNTAAGSFVARHGMRFRLDRLDQLLSVEAVALAAGASRAVSMGFEASASDSTRAALAREALGANRAEAEQLAAALGGRLGPVVEATTARATGGLESAYSAFAFNPFMSQFEGGGGQLPEVIVTVTVTTRYRLLPK